MAITTVWGEMNMTTTYNDLQNYFRPFGGVAVAFSGGVDSSLLLAAAVDALGDRALAVSGRSPSFPSAELREAEALAVLLGARHRIIDTDEMDDPQYLANPARRCYYCKTRLFHLMMRVARDEGLTEVVEGSNRDDLGDYRPGLDAIQELGIRSPFIELGLGKDDIRRLARERGLAVWDKPAAACLASRIPYGEAISVEKLHRIELAEAALHRLGFRQVRCRDHGNLARLEIEPERFALLADAALRDTIVQAVKDAGYAYVALDLQGYRRGAMNETL